MKSIDLTAKSFQNIGTLSSKLRGFVKQLASFEGGALGSVRIRNRDISARLLELVVQKGKATKAQLEALKKVAAQAEKQGVAVKIVEVP